jgi:outer membrane protein assembly factor BamD (BamD/ComL family)
MKKVSQYIFMPCMVGILLVISACVYRSGSYVSPQKEDNSEEHLKESLYKKFKDMSLEEALYSYRHYKASSDDFHKAGALERVLTLSTDYQDKAPFILELADSYTVLGDREKAQKLYADYQVAYPGNVEAAYAAYSEIKVLYADVSSADKDSTGVNQIIKRAREFFDRYSHEYAYVNDVEDIFNSCYEWLLNKEVQTMQFYLWRYYYYNAPKSLEAASRRLDYVYHEILPNFIASRIDLEPLKQILLDTGCTIDKYKREEVLSREQRERDAKMRADKSEV